MDTLVTLMLGWFVIASVYYALGYILKVTHLDKPVRRIVFKVFPPKPHSMYYKNFNKD